MDGSVAVIAIEGSLINKGKWIGSYSGTTSYEGVHTLVQRAQRDASVKGVVLEIDSYGGQLAGAFELGAAIAELSAAKAK